MKRLSISLLLCTSFLFGCSNRLYNSELIWPSENDIILFEIKETTKEDFIEKVDQTDCLSEDEKKMIKQYIFGYPHHRMVKWKYGKKIIISFDQYITRQSRNSKTGQLGESRSGSMTVDIRIDGKRVGGHDFNYD